MSTAPTRHAAAPPAPAKRGRHRLDDRTTDWTLLALFVVAQAWSSIGTWQLGKFAGLDEWLAVVPALLIDGVAFIAARAASSDLLPNEKGWRVRRLAGWIAASCFVLALSANVTNSHVNAAPGQTPLQLALHDALAGIPVLLLVASLVLRTRIGAWKAREILREEKERADAARREEQLRAQEEERRIAEARRAAAEEQERAAAAEAKRRAEELERQREVEAAAAEERERVRRAELEKARIAAEAARPAAATPRPAKTDPGSNVDPEWQARYDALPGNTKREKGCAWVIAEWDAGREPNGADVDAVIGGATTGRACIRDARAAGHLPPRERNERPALSLAASGTG